MRIHVTFAILSLLALGRGAAAQSFLRGDSNDSRVVDISDAVTTLNFLFLGGVAIPCLDAADANDDGRLDVSDPVSVLDFLYLGDAPPPEPYPECGTDSTADALDCASSACPSCFGAADLDAILATEVEPIVCLAAGSLDPVTAQGIIATVCPVELAGPCPTPDSPTKGCAVEFTKITGALDRALRKVTVHVEGKISELPVHLEDATFGNTVDCFFDLAFSGDLVVPYTSSTDGAGAERITDLLEPELMNETVDLSTTSTAILCRLVVGFQDLFREDLVAQLQSAASDLLTGVRPALIGQQLCPNPVAR